MSDQTRGLTDRQRAVLLFPLDRDRVKRDPGGNSYLPQQDVRAHLTRVFGFGNWSMHVLEVALVHEGPTLRTDKKTGKRNPERIDCLWRATVRLEVRDQHGNHLATYEDSATGDAQNSEPLAAHDLALKSAVSTALKRAATSLGDQFGLSLYNKGSMDAFVGVTLVGGQPVDSLEGAPAATEEVDPDRRPQDDEPAVETPVRPDAVYPEDGAPPPVADGVAPEDRAEQAVERRHRARATQDSGRRGPELDQAKGRLWDAFTEATDGAHTPQAERLAGLEAELRRRDWPSIAQASIEHLDTLTDYYREKADDGIRQYHIEHPDA